MSQSNKSFKKMIEDTAFDGIENNFKVNLDRKNIRYPKITFKGVPQATVIRSKKSDDDSSSEKNGNKTLPKKDDPLFPYPYDNKTTAEKTKQHDDDMKDVRKDKITNGKSEPSGPTVPKYKIIHRSNMDIQEFRDAPDAKTSTRPSELVVEIDLPLIPSAANVDLDIMKKQLLLESEKPARYKLDITLPYSVDDSKGSAKFDKSKRRLMVTLPVIVEDAPIVSPIVDVHYEKEVDVAHSELNGDTTSCSIMNGGTDTTAMPLIQVLSSTDSNNVQSTEPMASSDKDIWQAEAYSKPQSSVVSYSLPPYEYSQDRQTVSLTLPIKSVSQETVTKTFSRDNQKVTLKFVTLGSGGFPIHYSICVKFIGECAIVPDHCTVDVSTDNIVMLLLKEKEVRDEWTSFMIGLDENHLEEKLFVTEPSLGECLDRLEQEATQRAKLLQDDDKKIPPFRVTELNEEKLSIKISDAGDEEVDSDVSSVTPLNEIKVVHETALPKLQSILKPRTFSESSDDLSSSYNGVLSRENSTTSDGAPSPRGESDDPEGQRKSVSFSETVDTTTYKLGSTVSSIRTSLKNKRRRQKKRDQKSSLSSRRSRRSSGSSEYSSDDHGELPDDDNQHDEAFVPATPKLDVPATTNPATSSDQAPSPPHHVAVKNKVNKQKTNSNNKKHQGGENKESDSDDKELEQTSELFKAEKQKENTATKLSWNEKGDGESITNNSEDVNSALKLSNTVMFELDLD